MDACSLNHIKMPTADAVLAVISSLAHINTNIAPDTRYGDTDLTISLENNSLSTDNLKHFAFTLQGQHTFIILA